MKRFLCYLISALVLCFICSEAQLNAQAKLSTKKVKLSNFTTSITKVVINNDNPNDLILKQEVTARWRVSPFEFCSAAEYEAQKTNPAYYFLYLCEQKEGKYDGITTLILKKGGKEGHAEVEQQPVEVACLPVFSNNNPSKRAVDMMPAFVDIMQDYVSKAVLSDRNAYKGFNLYKKSISKARSMSVCIAQEDLSPQVVRLPEMQGTLQAESLISCVVAPDAPKSGMYCYKMLIGEESNRLYYFSRHRINPAKGVGFLNSDISAITKKRKK